MGLATAQRAGTQSYKNPGFPRAYSVGMGTGPGESIRANQIEVLWLNYAYQCRKEYKGGDKALSIAVPRGRGDRHGIGKVAFLKRHSERKEQAMPMTSRVTPIRGKRNCKHPEVGPCWICVKGRGSNCGSSPGTGCRDGVERERERGVKVDIKAYRPFSELAASQ